MEVVDMSEVPIQVAELDHSEVEQVIIVHYSLWPLPFDADVGRRKEQGRRRVGIHGTTGGSSDAVTF